VNSEKGKTLRTRRRILLALFFALFAIHFSLCTSVEALEVRRSVLPTGLTVLHAERHNLPIVMVTLLVKASPLNEPPEKAGLANLTASLLTEGTKKRKATEISQEIEFIGASLGASADSDYSTISLSVLKKDIEKGFDLFADVLLNPTFPEGEITRVRELIKGSLRQSEEEPSFVASKAFSKAVFGDLPYGRLVPGSVGTLDTIKKEDIERFHAVYYRPNNAILSVVGDITDGELTALVNRFLPEWKSAEIPVAQTSFKAHREKQTLLIDKDLTQANIILGHEGISRENPDYYAVSVMNYMLGSGGFSSRLMQTVRDELGLAYDIHSSFVPFKYAGLFEVGAQTKNSSANTVITEVLKEIEKIRSHPVSDQELDDAKAFLTGSFPRRFDTNRKIADFLPAIEFFGLGFDYIEKYPSYIKAVTKDDVLRVAKKYLDPENYVLVVVAKQSEAKIEKK
jgi:zinc protease